MKLEIFATLVVVCVAEFKISDELVGGCSSHCSVTTDDDLSCFDKTSKYYATTLMGIMRNWIASRVHMTAILKADNKGEPSVQDMVFDAKKTMAKEKPLNSEDEKKLFSVDQAGEVVKVLATRAKELFSSPNFSSAKSEVVCPKGCEESNSPYMPLFLASCAVNLVLFIGGVLALSLTTRHQEKIAKREFLAAFQSVVPSKNE